MHKIDTVEVAVHWEHKQSVRGLGRLASSGRVLVYLVRVK